MAVTSSLNVERALLLDEIVRDLGVARAEKARTLREAGQTFTTSDERLWSQEEVQRLLAAHAERAYRNEVQSLSDLDIDYVRTEAMERSFGNPAFMQDYLGRKEISNYTCIGGKTTLVETSRGIRSLEPAVAGSSEDLQRQIESFLANQGFHDRRWDPTNVELEVILADGARMTCLGWSGPDTFVTIRRPTLSRITLDDLVANGTMSPRAGSFLAAVANSDVRLLASGSMNSGKTVLLRAMIAAVPRDWHVVTIESQSELRINEFPDVYPSAATSLVARQANAEGKGELSLNKLVTSAQRMSPQLVVVGELRGDEATAWLKSASQGYPLMATIHGTTPRDAVHNIAQYYEEATGAEYGSALRRAARALDVVVHVRQQANGRRVLAGIMYIDRLLEDSSTLSAEMLWEPSVDGPAKMSNKIGDLGFVERMIEAGFDPSLADEVS